jgi:hypothetical protein
LTPLAVRRQLERLSPRIERLPGPPPAYLLVPRWKAALSLAPYFEYLVLS